MPNTITLCLDKTSKLRLELVDEFDGLAEEHWAELVADGKSIPWDDVKAYALARARGEKPSQPVARKFAR